MAMPLDQFKLRLRAAFMTFGLPGKAIDILMPEGFDDQLDKLRTTGRSPETIAFMMTVNIIERYRHDVRNGLWPPGNPEDPE